jgi:hypothetical protein
VTRLSTAYVDRWARASLAVPLLGLALLMMDGIAERTLWSGAFTLGEDEQSSTDFTLPRSFIGGVRIEARASLPTNRWAAFQVSLVAADGTALLELVKEAWAESGVWREDGETGTWSESDVDLLWDLRARADERVRLEVAVLDQGQSSDDRPDDADGDADAPLIPIRLTVKSGVIDGRFTVLGFCLSLGFAVLAFYLAGHGGRPVIVEVNNDSEVKGRADMGGPGHLVHVAISGLVDETAPQQMTVEVSVRDEAGVDCYRRAHDVNVSFRTDDGEIEDGRFSLGLYFEMRAGSWGVFVKATPDAPMEHLKLIVRDRATSRGPIMIETLQAPEAEAAS